MAIKNTLLGGTNWAAGDHLKADDLNDTVNAIGMVPVGAVVAWLKSFTNTPALNAHFVECNGQVLSDAASVYNGQTIPDLNGNHNFLRGQSTSGGTGGSETHTHTGTTGNNSAHGVVDTTVNVTDRAQEPHTHTFTSDATSTLPSYYEVVWVMRIK